MWIEYVKKSLSNSRTTTIVAQISTKLSYCLLWIFVIAYIVVSQRVFRCDSSIVKSKSHNLMKIFEIRKSNKMFFDLILWWVIFWSLCKYWRVISIWRRIVLISFKMIFRNSLTCFKLLSIMYFITNMWSSSSSKTSTYLIICF